MIKHRIELLTLLPLGAVMAEVGVAEGNFSNDLLSDGKLSTLYSVDLWGTIEGVTGDGNFPQEWHDKNYESAKQKLEKFGKRSIILRGMSVKMAEHIEDGSLDAVYLDAAHYKEGVKADLEAWYPKVKSGGIVAGHDYLNLDYGVFEAVGEFTAALGIGGFQIPENNINDASFYFIKK